MNAPATQPSSQTSLSTQSTQTGQDPHPPTGAGSWLVVCDVDSTFLRDEVIELFARHAGVKAQVAAVTEAAMRGELDFAQSLHERVALLAGLPVQVAQEVRAAVRLTPGAAEFARALRDGGHTLALVSGGFAEVVEPLARELGFLADLYPLLDASLQRVRALESERGRHHALTTVLHGLPLAVILLDDHLAPSCMSLEAIRICRRWSTDTERAGRLPNAIDAPLRELFPRTAAASVGPGDEPSPGTSLSLRHPSRPHLQLRVEIGFTPRRPGERAHHLLILSTGGEGEGIDASSPRTLSLLQCLSPSERKVALLVAGGLRNDMIAQKLCRSRKTIESQISSIFRKLNIANRTQLARLLN